MAAAKEIGREGSKEVGDKTKYDYEAHFGHHFPNPQRSASTVMLFPSHKWDSGGAR